SEGIVVQSRRGPAIYAALFHACIAFCLAHAPAARAVSFGGDAALTSDYIYRGFSETDNKGALQLDLHASLATGTFAGVWASTLDNKYQPYANYKVDEYIGQRFDLSSAWNTSFTATNHSYLGGGQYYSSDYQEISASVAYLDEWTFSISALPNALRYSGHYHVGRYAAYDAETTGQWLIFNGLFVTAGAGYYLFSGNNSPQIDSPTIGYAYGNVGLAYEWRGWRVDVGYFLTQDRAQRLFPYPYVNNRVAGTLSWHF
ncbi:MAG TPA: TorF family putative porin, partial [Steroidobacteraceae bacterium]